MRRTLCAVGIVSTVAGCGGGGATTVARTNALSTTVTVTSGSAPAQGVVVTLSMGVSGISPTNPLTSRVTDASGIATFPALPGSGPLCVSATLGGSFVAQCPSPFPAAVTLAFTPAGVRQ